MGGGGGSIGVSIVLFQLRCRFCQNVAPFDILYLFVSIIIPIFDCLYL